VTEVKETNTFSPPTGNAVGHKSDEWTRFLYQADASSEVSQQGITTYTVDVFNDAQSADQTALLLSMARVGGGKYFAAKNLSQIVNALKSIFAEIQSLNSTFASATLPISATNRSLNDNEVYIGMFRPDSQARPRWFGNLKRYQLIKSGGQIELGDAAGIAATDPNSGFVTGCATSFWSTDSGTYWADDPITPPPINVCLAATTDKFSDTPDGPHVEKGAVAEVIRKGNDPATTNATPTWAVNRNLKTLSGSSLVDYTLATSGFTGTNATKLYDYTRGVDVDDERANGNITETRPSLHGDVVHSRALAVAQGGSKGTTLYYGSNDGMLRAVNAANGKERWAFIAPEFASRLGRLMDNSPVIAYPGLPAGITPTPLPKDYFFDGSGGLFLTSDNTFGCGNATGCAWIYVTQRRGGRMIYAFDVSNPDAPAFKWRAGCTTVAPDDTGCTTNGISMSAIGQTWATPIVAFIKGYNSGNTPVVFVGGGYDTCEDANTASPSCGSPKGNVVYMFDGDTGNVLGSFATDRSVVADVAVVDIDYDGLQDYAYIADSGGNIYRIDFIDSPSARNPITSGWAIHKVAQTTGSGRKFLQPPALLPIAGKVYVALGSGDREKPLETNYPYADPLRNRFYVYLDDLATSSTVTNLDDTTTQEDFTTTTTCTTAGIVPSSTKKGWFMNLPGRGEQTVTSAVIAGGAVAFSTNRALPSTAGACSTVLGEARGYLVNLTNASGTIGSGGLCGGSRSSQFIGGGLPPSPVLATVRIPDGNGGYEVDTVGIGIVDPSGLGPEIPIRPRPVHVPLNLKRRPVYWFSAGGG
jgi:type IV pilus assembly protein PilY1